MNGKDLKKLEEFRNDLLKIPESFKEYLIKSKNDLVEYHDHSWKTFGKDLAATGLPRVFLLTFFYSALETVVPKLFHNSSEFLNFFPDMTNSGSLFLRTLLAVPLAFGGYIEDKFRTKNRSKGTGSAAHKDGKLGSKLNFLTNFPVYFLKFGGNLKDSSVITFAALPISYISSRVEGFLTDLSKYAFLGKEPSERIPDLFKKSSRWLNMAFASSIALTLAAGTFVNYKYSDYLNSHKNPSRKEIKFNSLEMKTLEETYPEFENFSKRKYVLKYSLSEADGTRVDTQRYFQKN